MSQGLRSSRADGLLTWLTIHHRGQQFDDFRLPAYWFRVNFYESTEHVKAYRRRRLKDTPEKDLGAAVIWRNDTVPLNGFLGTLIIAQDWLSPRVLIHESVHLAVRATKVEVGADRLVISNGSKGVDNEETLAYLTDGIASALIEHLSEYMEDSSGPK
ncbi:hypothetical protein KNU02_gp30 [Gordonia phage Pleakley]|uniref:Uncharacterized protein n=1 Tax=Gordonia phage Pleakley TaxID=2283246 RepID=A0A345M6E8_9CAUD|nr:hypothetical protein KNU02_gp30 [Gordonia phage Pleakley]AXH49756.1 hypothetical protein SEA_FURY_30 [Gordonia phage Fury]AXH66069.1 hypothetical protein SEA_PLEAKLEY_30 [Gordonia phage Pleakley]